MSENDVEHSCAVSDAPYWTGFITGLSQASAKTHKRLGLCDAKGCRKELLFKVVVDDPLKCYENARTRQ